MSMLWTAHGVKIWPAPAPVSMSYIQNGDAIVRAMPRLSFLMSDMILKQLSDALVDIGIHLYGVPLSEQHYVRRIALKPVPLTDDEAAHLAVI